MEDKFFSTYSCMKSLETSVNKGPSSPPAASNQAPATSHSASPNPWTSIRDLLSQAGGDPGMIYPHKHIEGSQWDKLTFREFILGLCRVSIYLEELNVPTVLHNRHVELVLEMASSNVYTTEAFLRYEHYMTTLDGKLQDWVPSHSHAQNLYFNRVYSFEQVQAKKKAGAGSRTVNSPPNAWWIENWPMGICYCFNWRSCNCAKCSNRHECVEFGGTIKPLCARNNL